MQKEKNFDPEIQGDRRCTIFLPTLYMRALSKEAVSHASKHRASNSAMIVKGNR